MKISLKSVRASTTGILAVGLLLISLSCFGLSDPSGELTLNRKNDALMVFTQWHFVDFKLPGGNLEALEFTAHVLPIFEVKRRVYLNLDEYQDQVIVMRAYQGSQVGENQFIAMAEIKIQEAIISGYFIYGRAEDHQYAIEGHFETEGNLVVPDMMGEDINYVLKARLTHK
ncbi:hypothetical protein SAMN04488029_1751 [Reichenbachiella faecimaris]|uniref:Lipoprotein n=1 Tax=Reichenbachiella faecimaris TaxID=692418 RepID=A0A1W2GB96_REIFA|nr:hypothetical protein [Reichenbachiella faecimaris]SMD33935.1 hypothetical protein SAMN04488029_1751 [Reichenbachiella faecimaris]